MCKVSMDLNDEKNLDFAIYSLVLAKTEEFSAEDLVQDVRSFQNVDTVKVQSRVEVLMKRWVDSGVVQEHWNTFSVAM